MLNVEGKKLDVYDARAFVDSRRLPYNHSGVVDISACHQSYFVFAVGALKWDRVRISTVYSVDEQFFLNAYLLKRIMSGTQMFEDGMDTVVMFS
jgi:hypothetical protein